MSLDLTCSPADAADLALARRRLAEASDRLRAVLAAITGLAGSTDWRTPTARRFCDEVDAWHGSVGALAAGVDSADGDAGWLQVRAAVRADGGC
jgi:hypothetical protein